MESVKILLYFEKALKACCVIGFIIELVLENCKEGRGHFSSGVNIQ
jgi:hypothetical protein